MVRPVEAVLAAFTPIAGFRGSDRGKKDPNHILLCEKISYDLDV